MSRLIRQRLVSASVSRSIRRTDLMLMRSRKQPMLHYIAQKQVDGDACILRSCDGR